MRHRTGTVFAGRHVRPAASQCHLPNTRLRPTRPCAKEVLVSNTMTWCLQSIGSAVKEPCSNSHARGERRVFEMPRSRKNPTLQYDEYYPTRTPTAYTITGSLNADSKTDCNRLGASCANFTLVGFMTSHGSRGIGRKGGRDPSPPHARSLARAFSEMAICPAADNGELAFFCVRTELGNSLPIASFAGSDRVPAYRYASRIDCRLSAWHSR